MKFAAIIGIAPNAPVFTVMKQTLKSILAPSCNSLHSEHTVTINSSLPGNLGRAEPFQWMTDREAAAYMKITPRILKDRARRGLIPAHPIPGGTRCTLYRFLRHELDATLLGSSVAPADGRQSCA